MTYEYRRSEGTLMRAIPPGGGRLEAWGARAGRWFDFPGIGEKWLYADAKVPEAEVPEAALAAPSIWRQDPNRPEVWTRA